MLNIDRALDDDRLTKAITGFFASEFNKLIERFREENQIIKYIHRFATGSTGKKP